MNIAKIKKLIFLSVHERMVWYLLNYFYHEMQLFLLERQNCNQMSTMLKKNILIVDDENLILHALSSAFRSDDTTVRVAASGKDALEELENNVFNLCFLDIHLPDMNGLDIMKKVRKYSPSTKIVVMTATEVDSEMLKSIQENANLLISKPFDLDRVKGFVEHFFENGKPVFGMGKQFYNDQDNDCFVNWLFDEKRQQGRYSTMEPISCSFVNGEGLEGKRDFSANILDINDIGMCIRAECHLKPGSVLRFRDSTALYYPGVVRWSVNTESTDSCRAGIQFIIGDNKKFIGKL